MKNQIIEMEKRGNKFVPANNRIKPVRHERLQRQDNFEKAGDIAGKILIDLLKLARREMFK